MKGDVSQHCSPIGSLVGGCQVRGKEKKKKRKKKRWKAVKGGGGGGRIHLLSAVVGRRNNWLLSPGKFPDQFLFKIDKKTELFSSAEQEHRREETGVKQEEEDYGIRKQAEEGGRWTEEGWRVTWSTDEDWRWRVFSSV